MQKRQDNKLEENLVIGRSNAVVQPEAVMIEVICASVAHSTML